VHSLLCKRSPELVQIEAAGTEEKGFGRMKDSRSEKTVVQRRQESGTGEEKQKIAQVIYFRAQTDAPSMRQMSTTARRWVAPTLRSMRWM